MLMKIRDSIKKNWIPYFFILNKSILISINYSTLIFEKNFDSERRKFYLLISYLKSKCFNILILPVRQGTD